MRSKGSNAERELVRMFWKSGFAACRVAGSGSAPQALPDILAGNNLRRLAIECKATGQGKQAVSKKQVSELKTFCSLFGAESWVGIRFDNEKWYFLTLEDMWTGKTYSISLNKAKLRGLLFDELIGKFKQEKIPGTIDQ